MSGPTIRKHNTGFRKPFSWSYSKLKNFNMCPHRHQQVDLLKAFKDGGAALDFGMAVHKAFHMRLRDKTPFPPAMTQYEYWARWVEEIPGTMHVEQQYAIGTQFQPVSWFGEAAWYRGIGDVVVLNGDVAMVIDWKTGKMDNAVDSVQLALMAQCIFSTYPEVKVVGSKFVFLKENADAEETFTRKDMVKFWPAMLKRIAPLEAAYQSGDYPPKPGHLCARWCPVTSCKYNGKGV